MLLFTNPGEIDPRAITTLGVNAKGDASSPIGFFGTGLKYAIAGTLRSGHTIVIQSGLRAFTFSTEPGEIRGKTFNFIRMNEGGESLPLGFTTELGKTWAPWMLYRELASNAIDEGGKTLFCQEIGAPRASRTSIYVTGLDEAHTKRNEIFLETQPLASDGSVEIHRRTSPSSSIFYRGVRVANLPLPSSFAYNILKEQQLTEDRTLSSLYTAQYIISASIIGLPPQHEALLRQILLSDRSTFEGSTLDFDRYTEGETFDRVAEDLARTKLGRMNTSAIARIDRQRKERNEQEKPEALVMTKVETLQLAAVKTFLAETFSIEITVPIHLCRDLGQGILGLAKDGEIFLSRETFSKGTKQLAVTLVEEWLHAERGLRDFERPFQDWCLEKAISLGEELRGKPL